MQVWLDPQRIDAVGLTTGEVLEALRDQNVPVSAGVLNQARPAVRRPSTSARRPRGGCVVRRNSKAL